MQDPLDGEAFCYLSTRGRVSGRVHTIEIWYAHRDGVVYLLSGGRDRSDWVRNLRADPAVSIRIGDREFGGRARLVEDPREAREAREAVFAKYDPGYDGDLIDWRDGSLPVAVDLDR